MEIIDIVRYVTGLINYMDEVASGNETLLVQRLGNKNAVSLSTKEYSCLKTIKRRQQSNESLIPPNNDK